MKIVYVNSQKDRKEYNGYILKSHSMTVTDLVEWGDIVKDTYGHKVFYMMAVEEGQVFGVLSLFLIKHLFFGKFLVTAPFGNDGGFYFDNEEAKKILINESLFLADRLDVDYLLIRTRENVFTGIDKFYIDTSYFTFLLDLNNSINEIWRKIESAKKSQIRKAFTSNFVINIDTEMKKLNHFFDILHTHMRELGSPFHKLKFYENMINKLQNYIKIMVVEYKNKPIGASWIFSFKNCFMNLHTSCLKAYNKLYPNDFLYWEMIKYGHNVGCKIFDMGRSRINSGTYKFKKQWGAVPIQLYYNYYLRKLKRIPDVDPSNKRYKMAIEVWRKLPLFITREVGPFLIRGIP